MPVAHREIRARDPDRQKQRAARGHFLVVQIAAMDPRLLRRDRAEFRRRRHAHHAKERRHSQLGPPGQRANQPFAIDRNMHQRGLVKILRQGARQRADHVVAPIRTRNDLLDPDLQRVARHRAGNRDRTGHDMTRRVRLDWLAGSRTTPGGMVNGDTRRRHH